MTERSSEVSAEYAELPTWLRDWVDQNPSKHSNLITSSRPKSLLVGVGYEVIASSCEYILDRVEQELIFVTCFWTHSASLFQVCNLLERLSKKALSQQKTIRVRIAVSSISLLQKLFHTRSTAGRVYEPAEWPTTLGIPSSLDLSGLDLQIKSVFVSPFSVFHSKFVLIDRKDCLVPSCNISWETWCEGCVHLTGPVVDLFRNYWNETWDKGRETFAYGTTNGLPSEDLNTGTTITLPGSIPVLEDEALTVFLPSDHHANPQFRILPCQRPANFPRTPLNTFTLHLLEGAKSEIFLQTPNVTSQPVLEAISRALDRGVSVRIVTNEKLMRLEQLVTAGTTTPWCLAKLVRTYRASPRNSSKGKLRIEYFVPSLALREPYRSSPVSSHIKITIVDGQVVLFGSGNMDRASWYTSQEVGVAVTSTNFVHTMKTSLAAASEDHLQVYFDSS